MARAAREAGSACRMSQQTTMMKLVMKAAKPCTSAWSGSSSQRLNSRTSRSGAGPAVSPLAPQRAACRLACRLDGRGFRADP
jgi:hypothetical protein